MDNVPKPVSPTATLDRVADMLVGFILGLIVALIVVLLFPVT